MRFQYIFLFFLVFTFCILFYLYRERDYLTPFTLTIYLGGSSYLLKEQGIFYTDPLNTIMFTLGIFFIHAGVGSSGKPFSFVRRTLALLALWYSFSLSVKASSIFLITIPLAIILVGNSTLDKKIFRFLKFFGYTILFFILIHIVALKDHSEIIKLINGFSVNFFHYAWGSSLFVEEGKIHFKKILDIFYKDFGILIYLFIPSVVISFFCVDKRRKIIKFTLLFILSTSIFQLSQQRLFLPRNVIPFYIPFLFLSLAGPWNIYMKIKEKYSPRYSNMFISFILLVLFLDRAYALKTKEWGFPYFTNSAKQRAIDFFADIKKKKDSTSYSIGVDLQDHLVFNNHAIKNFPPIPANSDAFLAYIEKYRKKNARKE